MEKTYRESHGPASSPAPSHSSKERRKSRGAQHLEGKAGPGLGGLRPGMTSRSPPPLPGPLCLLPAPHFSMALNLHDCVVGSFRPAPRGHRPCSRQSPHRHPAHAGPGWRSMNKDGVSNPGFWMPKRPPGGHHGPGVKAEESRGWLGLPVRGSCGEGSQARGSHSPRAAVKARLGQQVFKQRSAPRAWWGRAGSESPEDPPARDCPPPYTLRPP